jgi:hypothetical protein
VPFLRVIRDKRGYETTYLMHWYREGNRQRSRVLYVFRTPGGIRVGRDPLDRAVQQEIEARHPDIVFDWGVVVSNQQVIESAVERRRPRRCRQDEDQATPSPAPETPRSDISTGPPTPRLRIPSAIEGATPDEQIRFLAQWYTVIRERILLRTTDEGRRQALLALADRLNPVSWTDADQITSGLQQAAEALERLSRVFAKRRRRPRRSSTLQSLDASARSAFDPETGSVEERQGEDGHEPSADHPAVEPPSEPPSSEN